MKQFSLGIICILCFITTACTISYKFNGASIDYSKIKSISIHDFPNNAPLVFPPLSNNLSEALRDAFSTQTRLDLLRNNGDMDIEGEITGYQLTPLAIGSNALASETRLTLTVKVNYTNKATPSENFNKTFSVNRTFQNSQTLNDVQEQLCEEMIKELVDKIFNATAANW